MDKMITPYEVADAWRAQGSRIFHHIQCTQKRDTNGLGVEIELSRMISDEFNRLLLPVHESVVFTLSYAAVQFFVIKPDEETMESLEEVLQKTAGKSYNWVRIVTTTLMKSENSDTITARYVETIEGRAEALLMGNAFVDLAEMMQGLGAVLEGDEGDEREYANAVAKTVKSSAGLKLTDFLKPNKAGNILAFFLNVEDDLLTPFSMPKNEYDHLALGVIDRRMASGLGQEGFYTKVRIVVDGHEIQRDFHLFEPLRGHLEAGLFSESPLHIFDSAGQSVRVQPHTLQFKKV